MYWCIELNINTKNIFWNSVSFFLLGFALPFGLILSEMSLPGDISVQTLHSVYFLNSRDAVKLLYPLARMVAQHQCFSQFYVSEKTVKIFNNNIKKKLLSF